MPCESSQPPPRKPQDCQKPQSRSGVVEGDRLNTSGELDRLESGLEKEVHATRPRVAKGLAPLSRACKGAEKG